MFLTLDNRPIAKVLDYGQGLRVEKPLTISQWADKYRYLSPESSAEPGKWETSRTPYLREIMDTISDSEHEIVVFMASSQVGKTEGAGINFLAHTIGADPCPILVVVPNLDEARIFSKTRLTPMLRDCPILRNKVKESRGKQSKEDGGSNETLHKTFPGGHLTLVGSNSPSGLASKPIRKVYFDELDRCESSAGKEGDQVQLVKRRTATFWNRKIVLTSTPGIKGASRIETHYERSDKRKYHVPCPVCQEYQTLDWEQLKWDKGENDQPLPETAHFICKVNSCRIEEQYKHQMLAHGQWIAEHPDRPVAGFWLWAAYSPFPGQTWAKIVEDYLEAKQQGEEAEKAFTNTILGQSWEEPGEAPDWQKLMNRAEPTQQWIVPEGVLFLTAGVDVQNDRLEVSVWGWGYQEECWLIGHHIIYGDFDLEPTKQELDTFLGQAIPQPTANRSLTVAVTCMDTGFKTQAAYYYARTRGNVYAIKGSSTLTAPRIGRPTLQDIDHLGHILKKGLRLWPVGVHALKSTLYSRLRLWNPGPRYIHFAWGLEEEYYKQLTAEKLVTRYHNGNPRLEWHKTRPRNEALDCFIYAYAGALIAGIERLDWDSFVKAGLVKPVSQPAEQPEGQPALTPVPTITQSMPTPGPYVPGSPPTRVGGRRVRGARGNLSRLLGR